MNLLAPLLHRTIVRLLPLFAILPVAHANPDFNGVWTVSAAETTSVDPEARSTALDPWRKLDIEIEVDGDLVAITRTFGGGSRIATETMLLDTSIPDQEIIVEGWWDNRHIGAYLGNGGNITVSARWLDEGRTLQLMIDMILETSQDSTPVRVIREMRLSDDGTSLIVIEIRSSRNTPIVRTFSRVQSS